MSGTTAEGKVKKAVKKLLDSYGDYHYRFMPVPTGFGKTTLDFLICYKGRFLAIETKKPLGKPTTLQEQTIEEMRTAGAKVFVIDGDLTELKAWLDMITVFIHDPY